MEVLIVNTNDFNGGAAKAANRLHQGLNAIGIKATMIVANKTLEDFRIRGYTRLIQQLAHKFFATLDDLPNLFYPKKSPTLFSNNRFISSSIIRSINKSDADIVHLHWINEGFLKTKDIARITKPIVWSLHDMWAFTGGCHYDEHCGRFTTECGNCPILNSTQKLDLSFFNLRTKRKTYQSIKQSLTIIGLSTWMQKSAQRSVVFADIPVVHLPNPINSTIYKPVQKQQARKILNLPEDKQLLLFGANSGTVDPRKGFSQLLESLKKMEFNEPGNIELVIFGSSRPEDSLDLKRKTHYIGNLSDDVSLVVLYSACDIVIIPSLQENLSNVILESMSCGTPVVAFNIGGNSDLIDHKKSGYLATPLSSEDLAHGIIWTLERADELGNAARSKVKQQFSHISIGKRYQHLYQNILNSVQSEMLTDGKNGSKRT